MYLQPLRRGSTVVWMVLLTARRVLFAIFGAQSHHFLGELAEAEEDYNESIRLAPEEPAGT